jgi:hypothetical protein
MDMFLRVWCGCLDVVDVLLTVRLFPPVSATVSSGLCTLNISCYMMTNALLLSMSER